MREFERRIAFLSKEAEKATKHGKNKWLSKFSIKEEAIRNLTNIKLNLDYWNTINNLDPISLFQGEKPKIEDIDKEINELMRKHEQMQGLFEEEGKLNHEILVLLEEKGKIKSSLDHEIESVNHQIFSHTNIMSVMSEELGVEKSKEQALEGVLAFTSGAPGAKLKFLQNNLE